MEPKKVSYKGFRVCAQEKNLFRFHSSVETFFLFLGFGTTPMFFYSVVNRLPFMLSKFVILEFYELIPMSGIYSTKYNITD
jgi:hypothetical protein